MKNLPPGIFFDKARQRWRVRLYKNRQVVHLTYHPSYQKALEAYQLAILEREKIKFREIKPQKPTYIGLLTAFKLKSKKF